MEAMTAEEKIAAAYTESFSITADGIRELSRCLDLGWDRARACLPIEFPTLNRLMKLARPRAFRYAQRRGAPPAKRRWTA
ncbi:MAG: hypothetical protein V8S87_05495 [Oscillospiraceae bacterium]